MIEDEVGMEGGGLPFVSHESQNFNLECERG